MKHLSSWMIKKIRKHNNQFFSKKKNPNIAPPLQETAKSMRVETLIDKGRAIVGSLSMRARPYL
jgi:hypothetical protein